jgi:hypothetical protein
MDGFFTVHMSFAEQMSAEVLYEVASDIVKCEQCDNGAAQKDCNFLEPGNDPPCYLVWRSCPGYHRNATSSGWVFSSLTRPRCLLFLFF